MVREQQAHVHAAVGVGFRGQAAQGQREGAGNISQTANLYQGVCFRGKEQNV